MITGPERFGCTQQRLDGFAAAYAEAGHPIARTASSQGDFTFDCGRDGGAATRSRPGVEFDAVFAHNDLSAAGAMQALREAGRRVPQDVAVVGFDDIPMAAHTEPPLTTVHQPMREMGEAAARMLLAHFEGTPAARPPDRHPHRRSSSAAPPPGGARPSRATRPPHRPHPQHGRVDVRHAALPRGTPSHPNPHHLRRIRCRAGSSSRSPSRACSPPAASPPAATRRTPATTAAGSAATVLNVGMPNGPQTENNNPFLGTSAGASLGYRWMIYEPLVMWNPVKPADPAKPWLATECEWADGLQEASRHHPRQRELVRRPDADRRRRRLHVQPDQGATTALNINAHPVRRRSPSSGNEVDVTFKSSQFVNQNKILARPRSCRSTSGRRSRTRPPTRSRTRSAPARTR